MINLKNILIKKAKKTDHNILTSIAFSAKRHWNYPEHYYELWKDELTLSEKYISKNTVYKACYLDKILGFYSIVENEKDFYSGEVFVEKGFWLEHIFILPEYHKMGIGSLLIKHAKQLSKKKGIESLKIFVDPYASGFYDRIGAKHIYDSASSIPGRKIPVYLLKIND
ncbi:MAG: GNAT family N-acetyltransferase [Prolixibacteraceae bacterium]|nr:GNAT family N-acetyltransferase [Prolixibacteraceae bacterium]